MTVSKSTGKITFSFVTATLFTECSNDSLLAVSNVVKEGFDYDDFWLRENTRELFDVYLRDIHSILSVKLAKMAYGITDSFVNNGTAVSYSVKDNAAYNENILKAIDEVILKCIKNYVLREWFIKNELNDLAKYYNDQYELSSNLLIKTTIPLRKTEVV